MIDKEIRKHMAEVLVASVDIEKLPLLCAALGLSMRNAAADFDIYCRPDTLRDVLVYAIVDVTRNA